MPSGSGGTDIDNAITDGLPVARLHRTLAEGKIISIGGTLAAFDRAAHPNAQKLFVNWFLSREGQTVRHEHNLDPEPGQSMRTDIPPGNVPEERQRIEGEDYFVYDTTPETLEKIPESLEFMRGLLREKGVAGF